MSVICKAHKTSDRVRARSAGLLFLLIMAAHTTLETARDSLFLARLPVSQLPLAYVAIAVMALFAAELNGHLRARLSPQRLLALTLLTSAVGDLLFLPLLRAHVSWAPHAFYVFIGVIASLAVSQFWLLASELFTVLEAKRMFSLISAGGLFGAMLGGGLARVTAGTLGDTGLLALGAALFAAAACVPAFGSGLEVASLKGPLQTPLAAAGDGVRDRDSERYLRRVLAIGLLSTFAATLVDYVFKAEIARTVPTAALGRFFATFNFTLNAVALFAQFVVAPRLLSRAGVGRSLLLVPIVLLLGGLGVVIAPVLLSVLVLRGADGGLRNSLLRSSLEVLYMPLSSQVRMRWKTLVDLIGQRGGQAAASIAIFVCIAADLSVRQMAGFAMVVTLAWLVLASTIERRYVALFRAKIKAGSIETRAEVPALDLSSLESLLASLSSDSDDEVLATITLLVDYDRTHVIPSLLLYHPSRAVVIRTLEVFANAHRSDFAVAARRLLERDDDEVQAAAMLALAGQMTPAELRYELSKPLPMAARAAVVVAIMARNLDSDGACLREAAAGCEPSASEAQRLAFARAFRLQGGAACVEFLPRLVIDPSPPLECEVARAMLAWPHVHYVPQLLDMLGSRDARPVARDALVEIGEPALAALASALDDIDLPRSLRAHMPRSISRFGTAEATDLLLDRLGREHDGWVRFKLVRGLGQLRDHMTSASRQARSLAIARENLVLASSFLAVRIANENDRRSQERLQTKGGALLVAALADKEAHAIDRAVRLIGLHHSADVIHNIRQALAGSDPRLRADSSELLVHGAPRDVAQAMTALLDRGPNEWRLARATQALHERLDLGNYETRLARLLTGRSEAVRAIAAFHMQELGLSKLTSLPVTQSSPDLRSQMAALASEILEGSIARARRPS